MYIKSVEINNVRSISNFTMAFPQLAGWHVLIGDNGVGKSSIVRAIALALIGQIQAQGLRANWDDWLKKGATTGSIKLNAFMDSKLDSFKLEGKPVKFTAKDNSVTFLMEFVRGKNPVEIEVKDSFLLTNKKTPISYRYTNDWKGAFSVAYGPYRRFEGNNSELERLFRSPSYSDLAGHLSVFSESVALSEVVEWLKYLHHKSLEKQKESEDTLKNLKTLINSADFLPHGAKLESVNSDGVFFKDGNGTTIAINQMSDGYRSILSLTLELIRQLTRVYGAKLVFRNIQREHKTIDLPGVVLIDEIDAHLHPTWQTRIGQWFTRYFPNLQFIVTTHSPLVCRASEQGSIWRLAAPGSDGESGEVTGLERDRLIYGNILDAYGTEVFGENVSISQDSNKMLNRLAELNVKSMMGQITDQENTELQELRAKFPTETKIKK